LYKIKDNNTKIAGVSKKEVRKGNSALWRYRKGE